MKIIFINNSNNPDMVSYFESKKNINSKNIIYGANRDYSKNRDGIITSSLSLHNRLTLFFLIDCFIGIFLAIKLKLLGVKYIVFDTAHISNIPLALIAKIFSIKLVFTIHDWNPHEGKMRGLTNMYNKFVENFLANHFVVFSPIESKVPQTVLSLAGFKSDFSNFSKEKKSFLFFGRIQPYKGIKNLLDIAQKAQMDIPNYSITIMGKGSDPNLHKLQSMPNVNLKNEFIEEDELNNELKKTLAVLLPYDSATQSGVIIKSFSMGIPVIAFDVGALHYYINHGYDGFLIKHSNISEFVKAMKLTIEKNQTLSNQVKKNYEEYYSEKAIVKNYQSLIKILGEEFEKK
jgi:glycosyltransferase involved in cell wall biosynthesis